MPRWEAVRTIKTAKYLLPVCVLTTIVLLCFCRTIGSYFIADDFGQIAYASDIFKGNPGALVSNFTGNYMQNPSMKIYRPCLLLSLLFDWSLWHTNACGYFLSNILFFLASSVMLYLLLRELTRSWGNRRSIPFSLLSAGLFASSPLHCESISFISGRDNIISSFFYLLCLWCFVRKGTDSGKKLLTIGILSFWIAMLSKEMAIGLPVVLTGMVFFLPKAFKSTVLVDNSTKGQSAKDRLSLSMKLSMPIWISTSLYLLIRYLALGTVTGGYTGSIGGSLMSNIVERWTNTGTLLKILYPLNSSVFGTVSWYDSSLSILYTVFSVLLTLRLLGGKISLRWLAFLALWTFTTMAPMYQLWALGSNLEGARFFFFFSIPVAILIPFLLLSPTKTFELPETASSTSSRTEAEKPHILAVIALIALIVLNTNITFRNNIPWVHAGQQSKACLREATRLAKTTPPGMRSVLLGIPKEEGGAHIIYNGATFNTMISRPFAEADYSNKFITLDPLFYGLPQLINAQRLKRVLSDPTVSGLFVWNELAKTFDQLPRPDTKVLLGTSSADLVKYLTNDDTTMSAPSTTRKTHSNNSQIWLHDHKKGCELLLAPLDINPYQYDFIEFTLKASLPEEPISVSWRGKETNDLAWCNPNCKPQIMLLDAKSTKSVRIRLSDHWRWFTQGNITQLQLLFVPDQIVELKNIRLVSSKKLVPQIAIKNIQEGNTGVYSMGKNDFWLDFDASGVDGCTDVKIEISKPMYFFEGLSDEETKQAVMTTFKQNGNKGRINIAGKVFPSSGYYQLRAFCLNDKDCMIGEKSDPLTIFF
jgi:hypothetical protein